MRLSKPRLDDKNYNNNKMVFYSRIKYIKLINNNIILNLYKVNFVALIT